MRMGFDDGIDLIRIANEKVIENKAWQMWLGRYPQMDKNSYMPFEQFYQKRKLPPPKKTRQSRDDILKNVESINAEFERRRTK